MATLDHLILTVNDREASVRFYTEVMGFTHEGEDGPFSVIRVSPETTLQLAPWGTEGGEHLAFALSPEEFEAAFDRVRAAEVPYGDSFHDVGNMRGPGEEAGRAAPAPPSTCSIPTVTSSSCATTDSAGDVGRAGALCGTRFTGKWCVLRPRASQTPTRGLGSSACRRPRTGSGCTT